MSKIKTGIMLLAGLGILGGCSQPETVNETERRIESLVSKMTLEEKLGQMNQISPFGNISVLAEGIKKGAVGSILNEVDPLKINSLQRVAVEESRLGIPILFSRDVIHGFKTIFPIPLGQAASFNPEHVRRCSRIAAIEASAAGVRWTFGPMIDIARDPRWGRIAEGYGEDTYLTTLMGVATVKGFQGDSLNDPTSIAACPKHFVGYGAAESGRDYNSTFIPERQLRNVYLPPFEAAAKAGAQTFMSSFNDNDGVPSSGNDFILRKVLRDEWGFDGFVVSDWASVTEMIAHGFCADRKDAARKGVNAGVNMEMVSGSYYEFMPELLKEKKVDMAVVDEAVRNILRVKFRLGLFDNPYVEEGKAELTYYQPEHLAAAKQAAIESVVLLKNADKTLPVGAQVKTIAVTGPMADAAYDQLGTWVFDGEAERTVTPLAALRDMYGDKVNIVYAPGLEYSRDMDENKIPAAVAAARSADMVIAFVGEESILSGEAHCLADLNLQGKQTALLKALKNTGKPLVTVVMAGRPLTIQEESEFSDALLYAWHPGTAGGEAIAELLFGKESPSGRLPVTFPRMVGQIPLYYNRHNTGRPAAGTETLLHQIPLSAGQTSLGCTSYWLDAGFDELYPFGYGLTYADFVYDDLQLSGTAFGMGDTIRISCKLTNRGDYPATEVVQLYVQDKVGSVTRPLKELKRFERVPVKPGDTETVAFALPVSELAFWNRDMEKTVEPGEFMVMVGPSSNSGIRQIFNVK